MTHLAVHITTPLPHEHLERIRAASPRVRLTYHPYLPYEQPVGMEADLGDVEVLLSYHAYFEMTSAPCLRWLQLAGDGVNHLQGTPIMGSDVVITNARIFATPITEYVFASILSFCHRFPQMRERFQKGRAWPKNQWEEYAGSEVAGKTMAIIGYGSIGHTLARVAQSFEMTVIATRRSVERPVREGDVFVYPAGHLRQVLAQADFVVVCLPLTPETEGVIGETELRAMKPTAYLVSVGRGKVIDDAALLKALREGWIGGAGLDVHAQTPLPAHSPYFDLRNVILTPHMSGVSEGYPERMMALFCENLRRYVAGEALINVVDKRKGY
ncbi:MAG: D-2-hydroxyacid dehydrogenase [Armatimonadota bacterium]